MKINRIILSVILFGTMTGISLAEESYLKELASIQKTALSKYERATVPSGADGLEWQYFQITGKSPQIQLSDMRGPYVLAKFAGSNYSQLKLRFEGIKGSDIERIKTIWGNEGYRIFSIEEWKEKYDSLKVLPGGSFDLWVGEKEVLEQVWSTYLKPGSRVYTQSWLPMTNKRGINESEWFMELRLFQGKPFPVTMEGAARRFASGCRITALKKEAAVKKKNAVSWGDVEAIRQIYLRDVKLQALRNRVNTIHQDDMKNALTDMDRKFPAQELLQKYGKQIAGANAQKASVLKKIDAGTPDAEQVAQAFLADYRNVMLANPLLDDMELVAVSRNIGLLDLHDHAANLNYPGRSPRHWYGAVLGVPKLSTHSILSNLGLSHEMDWNSEIVKLSNLRSDVQITPLYQTEDEKLLIGNARLHWDGNRVAFNMGSRTKPMALHELDISTGQTKQLSPKSEDHFIDSCYLPDGNIVVMSTAIMTALACEGGSHLLSNMYLLNPENGTMRQLGIDQENSYHATVQQDGRVAYIRYEYTDSAHYFNRILMNMNPDGSNQREIYGSNSVWPTSMFYPQQVPGKPNLYSAVVSGHHGSSHMGNLVLFDVQQGRREADGAVQFIGNKDRPVEAIMVDRLYDLEYPKYMYSVPLDSEYYLTMLKPDKFEAWGLYLVDRFDNRTLIYEPEGEFIAWPQLLKKKPLPPIIPSRIREDSKTSTLYVQDIYEGPGLEGIKRGTVKKLAVYAFHYGFQKAASHKYIGIESGWDARYILGTVPVNDDGSVMFNAPAMLPISLLALDENGQAVQKMRTWMNPQPGEVLSCVGCHETADHAPISRPTVAAKNAPAELEPWYGPARPYSYLMEVQPVLDTYCISCHSDGQKINLTNSLNHEEMLSGKRFSRSYTILQKYTRRNGPESNPEIMVPMEWHASSSKLIQMLKKGHHGVQLDQEVWDRLNMWIDLNVPFHAAFFPGKLNEYGDQAKWREQSLKKYANLDWNPETEYQARMTEFLKRHTIEPIKPKQPLKAKTPKLKGWPFEVNGTLETMAIEFGKPGRKIKSYEENRAITKTLNGKERIEFVRIPSGSYVMGDANGAPNEKPHVVTIKKPFWMSTSEISNSQLQTFDPMHDSKFADIPEKDQTERGVPLYEETQPAVRISHKKAVAFCEWLSEESGHNVKLPTEEQWEWAARAGTETDTWYGDHHEDYATFANLSDRARGSDAGLARKRTNHYFLFDKQVNDLHGVTAPVKSYQPNPWGLYDMIGNAEEWTSTKDADDTYIVKGGSWFDRGKDVSSSVRWGYYEDIRLPDLGFRIIIEE